MGKDLSLFVKKFFKRPLEAVLVLFLLVLSRLLPMDAASALGGWIGRKIGPWTRFADVAYHNLRRAFPDKTEKEITRIFLEMWENIGRVVFEYPHLSKLQRRGQTSRIEWVGTEHLRKGQARKVYFSGHLANWEVVALGILKFEEHVRFVYRPPNNPFVHKMLRFVRRQAGILTIPKGRVGSKRILSYMTKGGAIGLLGDQKMNDGIAVDFFGQETMAASGIAKLARRFQCPVIPVRVERLKGVRFRITFYEPILPAVFQEETNSEEVVTQRLYNYLESWIRERPWEWLWIHRRWTQRNKPEEKAKNNMSPYSQEG